MPSSYQTPNNPEQATHGLIRFQQTKGADVGRELEFRQSLIRIGRMPDSDVNFDPEVDLDASGRHAEIRWEGKRSVLVDTESRNGTWVNGERVKQVALAEGDEIEFGRGGPRLVVSELTGVSSESEPDRGSHHSAEFRRETMLDPALVPVTSTSRLQDLVEIPGSVRIPREAMTESRPPEPPGSSKVGVVLVGLAGAALLVGLIAAVTAVVLPSGSEPVVPDGLLARLQPSVREVVAYDGEGNRAGLCLAFALRENLFVTTASCVVSIEAGEKQGATYRLEGGEDLRLARMWRHPDWKEQGWSPNIGFLEVEEPTQNTLALAGPVVLAALSEGDSVFLFPGYGQVAPAVLGARKPFYTSGDHESSLLVYAAEGAEGSPIVNAEGAVVGVHAGPIANAPGYGVPSDVVDGLWRGLQPVF